MDEENITREHSPIAASNLLNHGQKRVREKTRSSVRTPKWRSSFKIQEKWSLIEKSRLLEALKRYEPHNTSSIAKLVGTKSEREVEEKIQSLRGADALKGTTDRVDGPGAEKAPIEAWIDLVQEMTKHEPAEYSHFIPKLLGLITRNEKFADSGYPQLKWRNIYQFLTDITEDRVEVQKLSDMESLVVLDMMHSLGDTLMKSDTTEQRRILDLKYNLLNFKSDNPKKSEKEINIHRIVKALSNDLWDLEDVQGTSSVPMSASADASVRRGGAHSSEGRNVTEMNSGSTSSVFRCQQRSTTQALPGTSNTDVIPGPAVSTNARINSTDNGHPPCNSGQTSEQHLDYEENDSDKSSCSEDEDEGSITHNGVKLQNAQNCGTKFVQPKFFTLNPLCLPTQLLAFRPKTLDK